MKTFVLSAVKAGITRLRVKGGASPESLYDGANCYVTAARTMKPRPGSEPFVQLPDGTIGLNLFNGVMQVYTDTPGLIMPPGYKVNVLSHPNNPGGTLKLKRIWKAEPFMGALYVAAEWSNGDTFHYYLQIPLKGSWQAATIYNVGELTVPVTENGFTYQAHRLNPPATLWAASVERAVSDVIEPRVFNGFEYVVLEAYGAPPRSGAFEPAWPARDGAIVVEEADAPQPPPPPQEPPPYVPPPGYQNPGGGGPPRRNPGTGIMEQLP